MPGTLERDLIGVNLAFFMDYDNAYVIRKFTQVFGLFNSRVTAAYHRYVQFLKQIGVTGGTITDPFPPQFSFTRRLEHSGFCSQGINYGLAQVFSLFAYDFFRRRFEIQCYYGVFYKFGPKGCRMISHGLSQPRSGRPPAKSGIVLQIFGSSCLASGSAFLNNAGLHSGPGTVHPCCQSGRSSSQNQQIINLFHILHLPFS